MFSEWVKLKAILFSNIQNSKKNHLQVFMLDIFVKNYLAFRFHSHFIEKIFWINDLKLIWKFQIRSNQIRSLSENAIWSDLRSLFYQMILIWSKIRILVIFQYSAAQNQFETMRCKLSSGTSSKASCKVSYWLSSGEMFCGVSYRVREWPQ